MNQLGNLDSKNSLEIMNIIKKISKEKLVILVTHETNLANFYASRIIEIKNGKIEKDYKNVENEGLDYKLENKIYLKDFTNIENIEKNNINLEIYSNNIAKTDIKLIIKDGNIYIKAKEKIEVIDDNSGIELVDDHYQKMDKSIYQEYEFDLNKLKDENRKIRYSSIFGIFKSITNGVRKIANYSILKKILLVRIFCSKHVYCVWSK